MDGGEEDRLASCAGKQGFRDKALAVRISQRMRDAQVYKCRFCNRWHIGHRLGPRKRQMKAR